MLLAKASERLPPELWQRQIQVAETQYRLGELVQARITLGRVLAEHSSDSEVVRVKGSLDESFAKLAATSPILPNAGSSNRASMNSGDANPSLGSGGRFNWSPGMTPPGGVPSSNFYSGGTRVGNASTNGSGQFTDEAGNTTRSIPGSSVSSPMDRQLRR